ncbi:hypothetical protein F4815DRAFT_430620 [Daldinia loculata]|nr:hypothetical protein F4815DRAFT_430620 [Daldinia loculata]
MAPIPSRLGGQSSLLAGRYARTEDSNNGTQQEKKKKEHEKRRCKDLPEAVEKLDVPRLVGPSESQHQHVCIRQLQSPITRWNLDPDLEMLIWPTAGDQARGSTSLHPGRSHPDDVHPGPLRGEITVFADKSMSVLSDISQHI